MSPYTGSQVLFARRSQRLLALAIDHDWHATITHEVRRGRRDERRIEANRGDTLVTIWLSRAGAVLDVAYRVNTGRLTEHRHQVWTRLHGRGHDYAEAALTGALDICPTGVLQ